MDCGPKAGKITVTSNKRGTKTALHNGYRYFIKRDNHGTVIWRCVNRSLFCYAIIETKDDTVMRSHGSHTCKL